MELKFLGEASTTSDLLIISLWCPEARKESLVEGERIECKTWSELIYFYFTKAMIVSISNVTSVQIEQKKVMWIQTLSSLTQKSIWVMTAVLWLGNKTMTDLDKILKAWDRKGCLTTEVCIVHCILNCSIQLGKQEHQRGLTKKNGCLWILVLGK